MHGGFNEDAKTGIVYTGIPGWGLCSISPDLTTWTKLGDDKRLKGNIHGIVVCDPGLDISRPEIILYARTSNPMGSDPK